MATIHPKVAAATAGAFLPSLALAIITWAQDNPQILGGLPQWLQGLLILIIPTLATFVAGYVKPGGRVGMAVDSGAAGR